ncbi:lipoprotein [Metamycoplasma hominis ATCC 27545]|uniref:variable surface lipoprotein n=1 Tax=Metamycoplasma hominis TaxID=2098 RepID=UPI0005211AAA|nr:variable surface lipoprotein [Metamycoplasma hominis]AIU34262.1 lipoprotein [Metamycoplasma hominis ATCC 27545]
MKKSKKILLTIGIAFPLLASTPLVAAGCVETKKPEGEKPGTTPEKKPEGETTIENIINKHKEIKDDELNNTKSLLDQFKKSIEERTNQAALNEAKKQLNSALKHAAKINTGSFDFNQKFSFNKEYVKGLEAIKGNDLNAIKEITFKLNSFINLATSKKPGTTPEKKPEGETTIENIINKHKEIKDDELNNTKSLLDQFKKSIEERTNQAALNEAKKQLNSALKHAAKINTGSFDFNQKFSFNKEYVKGLEAIKGNDLNAIKEITFKLNSFINLATSKKPGTTPEKKPEGETTIENIINKHKEIKDDELNNTKSLLDQFKKSIEERTNQAALNEAKKQLNSALKHAAKINTGSFDFNQKFSFNKEYVKGLEAIKGNDLNAIKEITFKLNSFTYKFSNITKTKNSNKN